MNMRTGLDARVHVRRRWRDVDDVAAMNATMWQMAVGPPESPCGGSTKVETTAD
jgi:hypothetical protein